MATDAVSHTKDRTIDEERVLRLRSLRRRRAGLSGHTAPVPRRIVSARTEQENRASVGDFIKIAGRNLSFDPDDPRSGVFFVDYGETRSAHYAHVSPKLIIARVPDGLSSGPYLVRLRCASGEGAPREAKSASVFTVE